MSIVIPVTRDTANTCNPPSMELTAVRRPTMGVDAGFVIIELRDPRRVVQVSKEELQKAISVL